MGWFDEQIKVRIKNDNDHFENSFIDLSSVVLGKGYSAADINNARLKTKNAIEEILKYYKVKAIEFPDELTDFNEQLEYMLRPTGIMYRNVKLTDNWWKDAMGPMLGYTKEGEVVALLPIGISGYCFFDYSQGKKIKLNSNTSSLLSNEAICFYKPLPLRPLKIMDLIVYVAQTLSKVDFVLIIGATAVTALMGLLLPWVTKLIYSKVVPSENIGLLLPILMLWVGIIVSQKLVSITTNLINVRIESKMNISVSSAAMSRLMSLPASFFKKYSSGELSERTFQINSLCSMIASAVLNNGLNSLFSLIYIGQMWSYTPALVVPAMIIILVQFVVTLLNVFLSLNLSRKSMKISSKLNGVVFALFSGIQKIKLSGAEKRAFSKWSSVYKESASLSYDPPWIIKMGPIFSTIISSLGYLTIWYFAIHSEIDYSSYLAFNTAYGMVSAAILSLTGIASTITDIKPTLEMVEPILSAQPEVGENKKILLKIAGGIEINNVTFRYSEDTPVILDDISLKIRPGQYVAIVGKTGCGKSTLMRLILGFETPEKGAIYYDGKDINTIDLKSLRQKIGTVMQNGKLFSGDIFANITISAPWLTLEDAWDAARMAGFEDDIKHMPMGMHTIISEGSGSISGGQKQRLMIARAVAPKPKILMFDEATSALDNITQKQVSESLDGLKSTRIVIAHRLSTIRHCDRIIVLDKGKIIEDGTYDDLIAAHGFFAELVDRQRVDVT